MKRLFRLTIPRVLIATVLLSALTGTSLRSQIERRAMTSENDLPNPFGPTHFGFFKKVNRKGNASAIHLRFDKRVEHYFQRLVQEEKPKDRWNRHRHNKLMHQFGDFLGYTVLSGDPELNRKASALVDSMGNQ